MTDLFVHAWEEKIIIPTYRVGKPDKNPMFFEKRVYQGSSGVVYPHPVIEKIYDEKKDIEYTGLFLENHYLRIMILPELGGRIQTAFDKVGQRHFVYHNRVIKPALVGLCGPWISGGIEFNWPQHHRPSTYDAVDYTIEHNNDGSKTVWVNEVERMLHTKGMAGFTLYPDKAYLEVKGRIYNRTSLPQTFLWWANPAVKVNDHYQSVFPPDVTAVFDHGKRDVSTFPIATGTYYKVDYSPGTDISLYRNIAVPTSYMAIRSNYDFLGGYENDTQSGLLHVANHHISPGKKQWTWGHGDFGKAWDRNLTDEDGPYVELMTGVFTDNQPDFSWVMPYEEKAFTQYFMPYRELGMVKNANKDLLLYLHPDDKQVQIKIFATSLQNMNSLELFLNGRLIFDKIFNISPEEVYSLSVPLPNEFDEKDLLLIVKNQRGTEMIRYDAGGNEKNEIPEPAKPLPDPKDIDNNEQLFLTGLHLEQYRHATYNPIAYYEEALRRDPEDIRNNNALGAWYLRKGNFRKSEIYLRNGIRTLMQRNSNPYDGEPFYNLGLCLLRQNKPEEAYGMFYKAAWNSAWQDSACFSLAQIDTRSGNYEEALHHIQWSLDRNARNSMAWALKAVILRKLDRQKEAMNLYKEAYRRDLFNLAIYFEESKLHQQSGKIVESKKAINELLRLARGHSHNFIAYALDYAAAGLYTEAIEFIRLGIDNARDQVYPMMYYHLGWFYHRLGNETEALSFFMKGAAASADHCFPNRVEEIAVLKTALSLNEQDARAPYYLGCLWYDKRHYDEAIQMWELSAHRDDFFPTVFRNLGIAYFNKRNDRSKALQFFEKAFSLDTSDARVFMERDQVYKRLNTSPEERLSVLEGHPTLVDFRDDVYLERISILNFLGQYQKAYDLILQRKFHPWEGGEGKVSGQYIFSLVSLARQSIKEGKYRAAIEKLEDAQVYPHNLGEGKLPGSLENDIFYWIGCAYEGLQEQETAELYFRKAAEGTSNLSVAMFYNDQPPDKIFYQGLAWNSLGNSSKANLIFQKLLDYGKAHLHDDVKIDYFAVSLPDLLIFEDDLNARNNLHCHYMMGLGYLGLRQIGKAEEEFTKVLKQDMHFGAKTHLLMIKQFQEQMV